MVKKFSETKATDGPVSIWAPRFGSGLAGGDWKVIEAMIEKAWAKEDVTICDLSPF